MDLIFRGDAYATRCTATVTGVDGRAILLDRTVFYPRGGGQPGDAGRIVGGFGSFRIDEALKGDGHDTVLHPAAGDDPLPAVGEPVEAAIDWRLRHRHMRMHTCMHLLCAVVPGAVTGGQVGAEQSRLDFAVPSESLDRDALAEALNALIAADHPVATRWIEDEELAARPELVRTMSVKPPMGAGRVRLLQIGADGAVVDLQPCGGTHVRRTGEIGPVEIAKIENKGRQNRRVVVRLLDPAG